MCGIVGYFGKQDAVPILMKGLKRLEYRGYDSAGIAVLNIDGSHSIKKAGKVSELEKLVDDSPLNGTIGIGHTRWATHGAPTDINSHPHWDHTGNIAIVHNGIIENYSVLKTVLDKKGYQFKSETDTEVLVQLISDIYYSDGLEFSQAVQIALNEVVGAYGIVAFCNDEPNQLVAARLGSPLVLGIGENEYFIASDASPIVEHTRNVVYLDEGEMVTISNDSHEIRLITDNTIINKTATEIEFSIEEIEKKINSTYSYQSLIYIQNHYKNMKFFWLMGADNLINFHHWEKWREIFNNISIVVFKRHGYNNKALKSISSKIFSHFQIVSKPIHLVHFNQLPSWSWVNTREIRISSTEIRKQRQLLRGEH